MHEVIASTICSLRDAFVRFIDGRGGPARLAEFRFHLALGGVVLVQVLLGIDGVIAFYVQGMLLLAVLHTLPAMLGAGQGAGLGAGVLGFDAASSAA